MPLLAAALASFSVVGADCRWLVALAAHGFPDSITFATAPSAGWHNVPVLAEAILYAFWWALGERGLVLAQVAAASGAFAVLAVGLGREARHAGTVAPVSLVVAAGALPALVVVRNGLFSLLLFPVLLLLLERESRAPSKRIWLAVPLVALWSNLHGAVLVGVVVLGAYAVATRRRHAVGALVGSVLAVCATPALWHTPDYYLGVAHNEAAARGTELWAPLGSSAFDIVLVAAVLVLAAAALRGFRGWEALAAVALAAATVHSARLGLFLVMLLAFPAVRTVDRRIPARLPALVLVVLAGLLLGGLAHSPLDAGDRNLAAVAARTGQPVLADAILAEQVELAGGRVWVADPIDAFRRSDQRTYLDWLEGKPTGARAVSQAGRVLVRRDSPAGRAAARDPGLVQVGADADAALYRPR